MRVRFIDKRAEKPSSLRDNWEVELDCVPRVGEQVTINGLIGQSEWWQVFRRKVESVSWSISNDDSVVFVVLD